MSAFPTLGIENMSEKYFIITIDTEGDNQWDHSKDPSTKNAKYLPRFQELSEKYAFFPVWLTNYEMASDPFFVEYMQDRLKAGTCEIGMHLHAWHNPPEYHLEKKTNQRSYLIEYPEEIMDQKIGYLTNLLENTFQTKMISHRSGRWTTNDTYFKLLKKYGYKVDCSVTPLVNWNLCLGESGVPGSDYSRCPSKPYCIYDDLWEVPVTIKFLHDFCIDRVHSIKGFAKEIKWALKGRNEWIRPDASCSFLKMKKVLDASRDSEYVMFMLHSSEMMPGGSPSFPNEICVDKLFGCIERIFDYAKGLGYKGITLADYQKLLK